MDKDTHDRSSEQARPSDIHPEPGEPASKTEPPVAPPFAMPAGAEDEAERPVVNPVTGGAL